MKKNKNIQDLQHNAGAYRTHYTQEKAKKRLNVRRFRRSMLRLRLLFHPFVKRDKKAKMSHPQNEFLAKAKETATAKNLKNENI